MLVVLQCRVMGDEVGIDAGVRNPAMLYQPQAPRETTPPPGDIAHTGVGETTTGTGDHPTVTRDPLHTIAVHRYPQPPK